MSYSRIKHYTKSNTAQLIEALDLAGAQRTRAKESVFLDDPKVQHFSANDLLRQIPQASSVLERKINSSFNFLNENFPAIRILVGWTASGSGHQSSSLEVARQLRYNGYKGHIEVFWKEGYESKYSHIRSRFIQEMGKYPYSIEIIYDKDVIKNTRCELAMTGGYDYQYLAPKEANARIMLILQPYQWVFEHTSPNDIERCIMIEKNNQREESYHAKLAPENLNLKHLGHHYTINEPTYPLEIFLSSELTRSGQVDSQPVLNEILSHTRVGLIHSLLVYSINRLWNPQLPVINIIKGLLQARQKSFEFQKKTVILLVDNFSDSQKDEFIVEVCKRINTTITFCNVNDYANFKVRNSSSITICFSHHLPESVFTLLLQTCSLPPIFEGANTTNKRLCMAKQQANIAYMSFDDKSTTFLPMIDRRVYAPHNTCAYMTSALNFGNFFLKDSFARNAIVIADFLIDCLNPDSLINQYFHGSARHMLLPANNLLTAGVIALARELRSHQGLPDCTFFKKNKKFKGSSMVEALDQQTCKLI